MVAALICKEYGWTYQEYLEQPAYWLDLITQMLQARNTAKKE